MWTISILTAQYWYPEFPILKVFVSYPDMLKCIFWLVFLFLFFFFQKKIYACGVVAIAAYLRIFLTWLPIWMTSCLGIEFWGNFCFNAFTLIFFSSVFNVVEKFSIKSVKFFFLPFFLKCSPSSVLIGLFLYLWTSKSSLAVAMGWFPFLIFTGRLSICRFESFFSSVVFSMTTPSDTAASTAGPAAVVDSCWRTML